MLKLQNPAVTFWSKIVKKPQTYVHTTSFFNDFILKNI
jgi:hypothetical protein